MDDAPLELGRKALSRWDWGAAYQQLSRADAEKGLGREDLERLAVAAYLTGRDADAVAAWTRAHKAWAAHGECERAARCGFWIGLSLLLGGEPVQAGGWLSRTQRLLEGKAPVCAERGYLLVLAGLLSMGQGDAERADASFERALRLADAIGETELGALGRVSQGQALIQSQRPAEGVALLDEAMVAVTAGEVSPVMAGILYCAVINTCQRIFDLQRSREWTAALRQWCDGQPTLVAFRGACLVHRSEILQLQGEWPEALEEAVRACEHLAQHSDRSLARAFYQRAELHRLRSEFDLAGQMYLEAGRRGAEPQPGMSLLRLAQGDLDAAAASIRRVVNEAGNRQGPASGLPRVQVLGPFVEIMLAVGNLEAAHAAVGELGRIAAHSDAPFLRAIFGQAAAAVQLAAGNAETALASGREAWMTWQQLEVPYEAARVRVLIARACERLGDLDTARLHLEAAASVFERLGAAADLSRVRGRAQQEPTSGLTRRELAVLALLARGQTNRQIAAELHISEHTVARHLSSIYGKIGVASRSAATAFAFQHGLV